MSHKLLVKDRRGQREVLLVSTITIGRDPRCEISDGDAQLSRQHAEIFASDQGVVVRDLNSRNGMLVNGRRVLEAILHPGDVLQVASLAVTLVSEIPEPAAVAAPPSDAAAVPPAGVRARAPRALAPPLPETVVPEDDHTGLMSPEQVVEAAIASLGRPAGERVPAPSEPLDARPTVPAAVGEHAPRTANPDARATRGATPAVETDGADVPNGTREGRSVAPASTGEDAARPLPPVLAPGAGPAADAAVTWTASITWQAGALAALSCLIGVASALPWRGAAMPGRTPSEAMLLVPLVGLVVALGAGFLVAARLRRVALAAFATLAAHVRAAADGRIDRVADPLGTKPTGELAEAINDILARARRA